MIAIAPADLAAKYVDLVDTITTHLRNRGMIVGTRVYDDRVNPAWRRGLSTISTVDGHLAYWLDIEEEFSGRDWHSKPTGELVVVVRGHGRAPTRRFVKRRDGTRNLEKLAEAIAEHVQAMKRASEANAREVARRSATDVLRDEVRVARPDAFSYDGKSVTLKTYGEEVEFDRNPLRGLDAAGIARVIDLINELKR